MCEFGSQVSRHWPHLGLPQLALWHHVGVTIGITLDKNGSLLLVIYIWDYGDHQLRLKCAQVRHSHSLTHSVTSLHFTSLHSTPLHSTTPLHFTSLHFHFHFHSTSLHFTSLTSLTSLTLRSLTHTHHTHITHSHSHSLTIHEHTYIHTNSPTITAPSLLYFLFPSCFSMISLSLKKLVTCGVIRSFNFDVFWFVSFFPTTLCGVLVFDSVSRVCSANAASRLPPPHTHTPSLIYNNFTHTQT